MAEKIKIQIGTAIEESNPRTMESREKCDHRSAEDSDTYLRRNTWALKDATSQIVETVHGILKDTAGTGCGYCRQRNRTLQAAVPSSSWDGYTDRAENRSKYTDCAGCNERGRSGEPVSHAEVMARF